MEHIRRVLPRQFTDWRGQYKVDGADDSWRNCRVIDVSTAGAGLELLDAPREDLASNQIVLAIHLRGEIRNSGPILADGVRVGVQFVELSDAERAYLRSLADLGATW